MQISVDGVPSPHKTKKAGRRRISAPPASRFSLDSKAFPLAKLKSPQSIVSSTEDFRGDPAGTRTPDLRLKRALLYQLSYWVIKALRLGKGGAAK